MVEQKCYDSHTDPFNDSGAALACTEQVCELCESFLLWYQCILDAQRPSTSRRSGKLLALAFEKGTRV